MRDEQARTQFERAVSEAGIRIIHAHSPQTKGRIERSFGTLQNRLVKDLRLAGTCTIEDANRFLEGYLEIYNRRFTKEAQQPQDLHRPCPKSMNLDDIFCLQGQRMVNNGYIIKWRSRTFVLLRPALTLRKQKVVVRERFDGRLSFRFKGRDLEHKPDFRHYPRPVCLIDYISLRYEPGCCTT